MKLFYVGVCRLLLILCFILIIELNIDEDINYDDNEIYFDGELVLIFDVFCDVL